VENLPLLNGMRSEVHNATTDCLGAHVLLLRDGAAIMNEPMKPQAFTTYLGHSSRLIRARRYFIESYFRRHGFTDVHSKAGYNSFLFSMTADEQTYRLQVSEVWMVSSTHARVEERLNQLEAVNLLREYGAACLDVTTTGQEVMRRSHSAPLR
jgi:hypothetical protein